MEDSAEWRGLSDNLLGEAQRDMARRCFFGIDKETDLVRIAKAYMAISGDGRSNIVHENSLHRASEFEPRAKQHFVDGQNGFRQFDCILTNPPYGDKAKVLKSDSEHFELGHSWSRRNGEWRKGAARNQNPYVLFVERCFQLCRDGGHLAIVLPEIAFHGNRDRRLRDFITENGRIIAVIDLPHNTFRPYCNAKTCLLVVKKGEIARPNDKVIMAEAVEMGHDHQGRPVYRPNSKVIWDDLVTIADELNNPKSPDNRFVTTVRWEEIVQAGHLVPRYFTRPHPPQLPEGRSWVRLGDLVDEGIIDSRSGHGAPASQHKNTGPIPYFRTSDIVNWELYRNPVTGVPRDVFEEMTDGKPLLQERDVLMVRRGSYRCGTVAMAAARDSESIVMAELQVFSVSWPNRFGITAFYLLGMLSSEVVQKQMQRITFIDTTLPNLGRRWRELLLPVHASASELVEFSVAIEAAIKQKWEAQQGIEDLRQIIGGDIVT